MNLSTVVPPVVMYGRNGTMLARVLLYFYFVMLGIDLILERPVMLAIAP